MGENVFTRSVAKRSWMIRRFDMGKNMFTGSLTQVCISLSPYFLFAKIFSHGYPTLEYNEVQLLDLTLFTQKYCHDPSHTLGNS